MGGLGDFMLFFRIILYHCIPYNKRLYFKKNNIEIENYIKLKYDIMYITDENTLDNYKILTPLMPYGPNKDYPVVYDKYNIYLNEIFYFSNEVIINRYIKSQKSQMIFTFLLKGMHQTLDT
jgi:hypothetical protein